MAKTILKTEGLTKHYGGIHALVDADFEIKEGEHIAIVGDNGAGKSTFVRQITGVEQRTGGRVWFNGNEVFTTRETKAAAPEQHKVAVKLLKGKNAVLLKVANGNNPHGFYFSLTSAEETKVVGRN